MMSWYWCEAVGDSVGCWMSWVGDATMPALEGRQAGMWAVQCTCKTLSRHGTYTVLVACCISHHRAPLPLPAAPCVEHL